MRRNTNGLSNYIVGGISGFITKRRISTRQLSLNHRDILGKLTNRTTPRTYLIIGTKSGLLLLNTLNALQALRLSTRVLLRPIGHLEGAISGHLSRHEINGTTTRNLSNISRILLITFISKTGGTRAPNTQRGTESTRNLTNTYSNGNYTYADYFCNNTGTHGTQSGCRCVDQFRQVPFSSSTLSRK